MKSFFKSKKFLIIIIALLFIALIIMGVLLFKKSNNSDTKDKKIVSDYIAYVKINPAVKLQYSQTCNEKNECTDPIVTNYELINDDAKNIYKDIDLIKDENDLITVLDLITQTAKDNNINFEQVEIYSDWNNINKYVEEKSKNNSQNWNYNVKVSNREELNNVEKELTGVNDNEDNNQTSNNENNSNNKSNEKKNNTNNSSNNTKSDDSQEPKEWTNVGGDFYFNGEGEGYGDYRKGEHVCVSSDFCYRWYKFVDTSKLGCKDANDKTACKNYWINFYTPKVAETKKDMENAQKSLNDTKALQERDKKSLEEAKEQLKQCEARTLAGCETNSQNYDSMLSELKRQAESWESQVHTYDRAIYEAELILQAETNDYNEHLRALNIYKSL